MMYVDEEIGKMTVYEFLRMLKYNNINLSIDMQQMETEKFHEIPKYEKLGLETDCRTFFSTGLCKITLEVFKKEGIVTFKDLLTNDNLRRHFGMGNQRMKFVEKVCEEMGFFDTKGYIKPIVKEALEYYKYKKMYGLINND